MFVRHDLELLSERRDEYEWACHECRFNFYLPPSYTPTKGHPFVGSGPITHVEHWEEMLRIRSVMKS